MKLLGRRELKLRLLVKALLKYFGIGSEEAVGAQLIKVGCVGLGGHGVGADFHGY